jgi:hypothetical protein
MWKEIPGYEGYYSVSNFGRVRSEERIIERKSTGVKEKRKSFILKPWINHGSGKGYEMVGLCKGVKNKLKIAVHRLVLWAFVGLQEKGIESRHLDGNCKNNCLSNLAYGTKSDNMQDAVKHRTLIRPIKLKEEDVVQICKMGREKTSSLIVSRKFKICRNTVTEIWRGDIWKHATEGLRPESNQLKKYHKISEEHKKIIIDSNIPITQAAKILGIERHTAAIWRKKFTQ